MVAAPPPSLTPLKPCYVTVQSAPEVFTTEPLPVGGSGFAANERLKITVDGSVVVAGVSATSDGVLAPQVLTAPPEPDTERAFSVVVANAATGRTRASASSRASALAAALKPASAKPADTVTFTGRGFTGTGPIYAHYVRRNQLKRTVQLTSAPTGACGRFTAKRPQFPFKPTKGVWRIQVDQHPTLGTTGPLVNLSVDVKQVSVTQRRSR